MVLSEDEIKQIRQLTATQNQYQTAYGFQTPNNVRRGLINAGGGTMAGLAAGQMMPQTETAEEGIGAALMGTGAGALGGAMFGPGGMIAGGVAGGLTSIANSYFSVKRAKQERREAEKTRREVKLLQRQALRQARADQAYERAWNETLRQDQLAALKQQIAIREGETEWEHEQRVKEFLASEAGRVWAQQFQEKQFAAQEGQTAWQREESNKDRVERAEDRQYSRGQQALMNRWQALKFAQEKMNQLVTTNQDLKDRMLRLAR